MMTLSAVVSEDTYVHSVRKVFNWGGGGRRCCCHYFTRCFGPCCNLASDSQRPSDIRPSPSPAAGATTIAGPAAGPRDHPALHVASRPPSRPPPPAYQVSSFRIFSVSSTRFLIPGPMSVQRSNGRARTSDDRNEKDG